MRLLIVVFVVLLASPLAASAQPAPPACADADVNRLIGSALETLAAAQGVLTGSGAADALTVLADLETQLGKLQAACAGLQYQGDASQVIGPIAIPAGVYRVHGEFSDPAIVAVERIDGDCGMAFSETSALFTGSMDGGSEQDVFRSEGCNALLSVQLFPAGEWSVAFERVG